MFRISLVISLMSVSSVIWGVSCDELNRLWRTKYHSDFKVDWENQEFACDGNTVAFAAAIYELDHLVLRQNSSGYAPDFYRWVVDLVKQTSYKEKNPRGYIATSYGGYLTLYKTYFSQSLEWRTSSLVHENRHNQGDDPRHVDCAHGANKGHLGACDAEFFRGAFAGSGYNYDFIFQRWIRDAAEVTGLDKQIADTHVQYLLLNQYNKISNEDIQKYGK